MMTRRSERRSWVVAAIAGVLGFVASEIISFVTLKRHGKGIDGMSTVAWTEHPDIDRELLSKFTSFDPELGWCPQPNTTKQKDTGEHLPGEEVEHVVEYSTDEYGSRVCPARPRESADDTDVTVSTYGDSYCFCRGVDDDETFQHYLAQRLETHVPNYGAGNYGFDQALMRLKRRYPDDPTDYVVIAVTASSIARILSTWKHYQEFGNVLAVKPRYALEDSTIERYDIPFDEKKALLDIESYTDVLQSRDGHYDDWFQSHLVSFPYVTDLFRNPHQLRYAFYAELEAIERRLGTPIPGIDVGARLAEIETRLERERVAYHDDLFDDRAALFEALVDEFVAYAEQRDFTPVFAMVQQRRYAEYEAEHGAIYGNFLDRLDEKHDRLRTVDVAARLDESTDDVASLYVRRGEGGHYSPETNERIADILAEEIRE